MPTPGSGHTEPPWRDPTSDSGVPTSGSGHTEPPWRDPTSDSGVSTPASGHTEAPWRHPTSDSGASTSASGVPTSASGLPTSASGHAESASGHAGSAWRVPWSVSDRPEPVERAPRKDSGHPAAADMTEASANRAICNASGPAALRSARGVHAAPGRCLATIHKRWRSIAIAAVQARNLLFAGRMDIIGIVLALFVASYLIYALLRPERF